MATCFHHTDRETGRACTRCGRPACPECLTQAHVGSHCWECIRAAAPPRVERVKRWWRFERLVVTKAIIAITVISYILMSASNGNLSGQGRTEVDWALFGPAVSNGEWYRLVTSAVVHYGLLHLAFNMLVLYQVGAMLEPGAGRLRFGLLYLVSVLAGSFGALLHTPLAFTGGASGGVFGVAGAATLAMHRQGVRFWDTGFGPLLAINLVITFTLPGISIGGHLGGLAGGTLAAEVMLRARRADRAAAGVIAAAAIGVLAYAGAVWVASNPV